MSGESHGAHPTDYFDTAYRDYEDQNPARKLDHYLDVIETSRQGDVLHLLDIGCGKGAFLGRAHARHPRWELHGVDVSEVGVEETRKRVPEAVLRVSSADALPFPPGSFDVITAWDVLEHLDDLSVVRSGIASRLRDGGLFVFVVPVYDGVTGPLIRRLDRDPTHVHKRSRHWWVEWARDSFSDVEWHGVYRYLLPGGHYVHVPTTRMRAHTAAILVAARKA
jgi:SAM-dependent methyltransferase